jgi:hypothetical protein
MKIKQFFSAVIFGMLVSSASASTVPTTMTFSLGMGETFKYTNTSLDSVNYPLLSGDVAENGFDRWVINLTDDASLLLNFVTGQDTTQPYDQLDKAVLSTSTGDALATQLAVISNGGITSTILMSYSNLLAGSYFLDIYGDAGMSYSASVSAVPLPAAAWLFGSAAMGLLGFARRRKQADVAAV